jgi:hypothetical protein
MHHRPRHSGYTVRTTRARAHTHTHCVNIQARKSCRARTGRCMGIAHARMRIDCKRSRDSVCVRVCLCDSDGDRPCSWGRQAPRSLSLLDRPATPATRLRSWDRICTPIIASYAEPSGQVHRVFEGYGPRLHTGRNVEEGAGEKVRGTTTPA